MVSPVERVDLPVRSSDLSDPQDFLLGDEQRMEVLEIDWGAIQIDDRWEEEGEQETASESVMYDRLGLLAEDERETTERQETVRQSDEFNDELPCTDCIPQERVFECNRSNPVMKIGSLYKDMKEFRLAIRQYAINNEFELGIESSSPFRYRAYCKGGDCPWRINARLQNVGSPTVVVTVIVDKHTCTSSGRRKTTTPTSSWVASLAMPFLTKKPHMGAKELQNTLQEQHNCTISYDTVWKGLTSAVNDVFPNAEKRECFRHLMQNYVKHFTGSEHMYPAARAYRNTIFEHHFSKARDILGVKQWIDEWHPLLWYRCGFNTAIKCDYITNNIAEKEKDRRQIGWYNPSHSHQFVEG
ncbi:uncharacterized protein [Zea mays]|uniref:uncharacterized protein n=1 Tax=Zea mays TaxID=4577 RepID=UPI0009A96C21|nr:uncharacterized protein LOC103652204 [Zea mays]|eukprot:XP_020406494.1 uncharacterized protein LOC103652204 [Zea mays]